MLMSSPISVKVGGIEVEIMVYVPRLKLGRWDPTIILTR
jgi:hypothetical protein